MGQWKQWVREVKREVRALGLALSHPGTPWYAKALALVVVAYAVSPIDLIPDPIPVLGYLDDAILLPLGVWLVVRMVPPAVMAECRERAADQERAGRSWLPAAGGVAVVVIWLAVLAAMAWGVWWLLSGPGSAQADATGLLTM